MSENIPFVNSIFEQPWWLDIVAKGKWSEATVKENGEIIARMPYCYDKKRIYMPRLTQTLGPWIKDRSVIQGNSQFSRQKEIISELLSQLPKYKSFVMNCNCENTYILPYRWHGFTIAPTFSYRLCDISDTDKIYESFHKIAKKNIKAAQKKVVIKESEDVEELIALSDMTFSAQNRKNPLSHDMIREIFTETKKRNASKLFSAVDEENNIHACVFIVYDENVCYYLIGGSNPEFKSSGAATLAIWEAIKYASEYSRAFDFEGSMVEGIENFFRQFGGVQVINYTITKRTLIEDIKHILKPRIKKKLKYKI